jgi:2-keto-3-deoxy-L-rhamnonate aldolase RhmA
MRTPIDHIKAKRARGEPALGVIVQTGCADNVEMAGAASLDCLVLATEHGSLGDVSRRSSRRLSSVPPSTATPDHSIGF